MGWVRNVVLMNVYLGLEKPQWVGICSCVVGVVLLDHGGDGHLQVLRLFAAEAVTGVGGGGMVLIGDHVNSI